MQKVELSHGYLLRLIRLKLLMICDSSCGLVFQCSELFKNCLIQDSVNISEVVTEILKTQRKDMDVFLGHEILTNLHQVEMTLFIHNLIWNLV